MGIRPEFKVILVCICYCDKDHEAKATWGRRGYVYMAYSSYKVHCEGKSGQELKSGASKQEPKLRPWRNAAYSPWLAVLYKLGPPAHGWCCPQPRVGWAIPSHSLVQYLTGVPAGQSTEGCSLFEVTLIWVKLVKTNQHKKTKVILGELQWIKLH